MPPKSFKRPSSNSNASPPSSRSRSPLRAPPSSEPRPQDAPHKQRYNKTPGVHLCASCRRELPQDPETGWENWVLIAPGHLSKHEADDILITLKSLVDFAGPYLDKDEVWVSAGGCYLAICKSCMIKWIDILPEKVSYDKTWLRQQSRTVKASIKEGGKWPHEPGPHFAETTYDFLRGEVLVLEKEAGAIIAALLREQLRMKVKNARDNFQAEAKVKAEVEKKEDDAGDNAETTNDSEM